MGVDSIRGREGDLRTGGDLRMFPAKGGRGYGRASAAAAVVATGVLSVLLCTRVGAAEDVIGRPVDLDVSKGVQAPPRDASKLPGTFAEAAKTQPVDPKG